MTSMRTTRNSLTRSYIDSPVLLEKELGIIQNKNGPEIGNPSLKEGNDLRNSQDSNDDFSLEENSAKKRKKEKEPPKISGNVDVFCWRCHKSGDCIPCSSCPRVYHLKCAQLEDKPTEFWPCIECDAIKRAESASSGVLSVDTLLELLSFTVERMKSYPGSEHFCAPVNTTVYSDYKDYVLKPMDISQLDLNIKSGMYSTTESFISDTKWMVHNSYIYNSAQSYLTVIARGLFKVAKQECEEIDNCQYCYRHAHTIPPNSWFLEPCEKPHLLIWAKLSGFPFWPAKVMKITGMGVDVRFFGDHNRSIVPPSACMLLSRKRPSLSKGCIGPKLERALEEVETHIKKLEAKFQCCFVYADFRREFDPRLIKEYIAQMLQKSDSGNRERSLNFNGVKRKLSPIDLDNITVKKSEHVPNMDVTNYENRSENLMIITVPSQCSAVASSNDDISNKEKKAEAPRDNTVEATHQESNTILIQQTPIQTSPVTPNKDNIPKIRIRTKEELNQIAIKNQTSNLKEISFTPRMTCSSSPVRKLANNHEEISNNLNKIFIPAKPILISPTIISDKRNDGKIIECNKEIKSKDLKSPNALPGEESLISGSNISKYLLIQTKPTPSSSGLPDKHVGSSVECNKEIKSKGMKSLNTVPGKETFINEPNNSNFFLIQAKPTSSSPAFPDKQVNNNKDVSKDLESCTKNLSKETGVSEGNNFKYLLIKKTLTPNLPNSSQDHIDNNRPENKLQDPKSLNTNLSKETCTVKGNNLRNVLIQKKPTPTSLSSPGKHNNNSLNIVSKETVSISNDEASKNLSKGLTPVKPTSDSLSSSEKRKLISYISEYSSDTSRKSRKKRCTMMNEIIIHNSNGEEISPRKFRQILRNNSNNLIISNRTTAESSGNEMSVKTSDNLKHDSTPSVPTTLNLKCIRSNSEIIGSDIVKPVNTNDRLPKDDSNEVSVNHQKLIKSNSEVISSDINPINNPLKTKSCSKKDYPLTKNREQLVVNQNLSKAISKSELNKDTVNSSASESCSKTNGKLENNSAASVPVIINHQKLIRSNSEVVSNDLDLINKPAKMESSLKTNDPIEKSCEHLVLNQNSNEDPAETNSNLGNKSAPSIPKIIHHKMMSNSQVISGDLINEPATKDKTSETNCPLKQDSKQLLLNQCSTKPLISAENAAQISNLKEKKHLHSKTNDVLFSKHVENLKQSIVSKRKGRNLEKCKVSPQKNNVYAKLNKLPNVKDLKKNKTNINRLKPMDPLKFKTMRHSRLGRLEFIKKRKVPEVTIQDVNPLFFQHLSTISAMTTDYDIIKQNSSYEVKSKPSMNKRIETSYSTKKVANELYPKLLNPSSENLPSYYCESLEDSLPLRILYDTRYLNDERLAIILKGKKYLRPIVVLEKIPDKEFNKLYEDFKLEKSRQNFQFVTIDEDSEKDNIDCPLNEEISPEEMLKIIGVKSFPDRINYIEELQMAVSNENKVQKQSISEQAIPSKPTDSSDTVGNEKCNNSPLALKDCSARYPHVMKTVDEKNHWKGHYRKCRNYSNKGPREEVIRKREVFRNLVKKHPLHHPASVRDEITEDLKLKNIPVDNIEKLEGNRSQSDKDGNKSADQSDQLPSSSVLDSSARPSTSTNERTIPNQEIQCVKPLKNDVLSSTNSQPSTNQTPHFQKKVENVTDQRQFLLYIPPTNLTDFVKNFTPTTNINANKEATICAVNNTIESSKLLENTSVKLNLTSPNINNNINFAGNVKPLLSNVNYLNTSDQATFLTLPSTSNSSMNSILIHELQMNLQSRNDGLILNGNNSNNHKILFIPTVGGQHLLKLNHQLKQPDTNASVENISSNVSIVRNNPAPKNLVIKLVPIIDQNINNSEQKVENFPKNQN